MRRRINVSRLTQTHVKNRLHLSFDRLGLILRTHVLFIAVDERRERKRQELEWE